MIDAKAMNTYLDNIISIIENKISLSEDIKKFLYYRYEIILSKLFAPSTFEKEIRIGFCTDLNFVLEVKLLNILTLYFSDISNVSFFSGLNSINENIDLIIHTGLAPETFLKKKVRRTLYVDTRAFYSHDLTGLIDLITKNILMIREEYRTEESLEIEK